MKIVQLVLVGSLALVSTLAAGCGANPCQDATDAIDAASKLPGCAEQLKMYKVGVDPENCTADSTPTKVLEADTKCFNDIKACDIAGQIALGQCLSRAQSGG